jgi:type I pantothenate kinase
MQASSPFTRFTAEQWSRLRADTPMTLSESDLGALRGLNEPVSLDEVERIYLPLSRLLSLYIHAAQRLYERRAGFLGDPTAKVPFVIGLAGSVAVGKSTTARILRALLARWPKPSAVEIVTTDGFLLPNAELAARGLMDRKGFPESYDRRALLTFLSQVKAGRSPVHAPVYSHVRYDVLTDERLVLGHPDVLIVEGLNVLQPPTTGERDQAAVSDFFDFSIYVDAEEHVVRRWYAERFLQLRDTAFRQPESHFRRYADLDEPTARRVADEIWREINGLNLRQNIRPTRGRGDLILHKTDDHRVSWVQLRKL